MSKFGKELKELQKEAGTLMQSKDPSFLGMKVVLYSLLLFNPTSQACYSAITGQLKAITGRKQAIHWPLPMHY